MRAALPPPVVADEQERRPPDPPPAAGADVVVVGRSNEGDPLQSVNAGSYDAVQAVDRAVIGPASRAYRRGVPGPLRTGLRNFLNNLREPVVAVNYLLQVKPGKAAETVGRFAINSTAGVAGVFDVAKRRPFRLPRRRNGFDNTLGYYGVGPGPFFFLPLIGPTTLRDLAGNVVDQALIPIAPIRPAGGLAYTVPIGVLSALDFRAEFDEELEKQRRSGDPYAAARRYYLERRQAEIDALRGRRPPAPPPPAR